MQCNDLTFLENVCNAWYLNINEELKMRLQAVQNKCIRFCLKLNDRCSIKSEDFEKINWLSIHERVSQYSLCSIYKLFTKNCPNYFDEIYVPLKTNGVHKRSSYQKLNVPHQKTNVGQKALSYVGPSHWNNLNKTLKTSTRLNTFKHYLNNIILMN